MKFFLDNNLSPKLAHALHTMVQPEHTVVHLKDRFPADTEDVHWMRALAQECDLAIITADMRIRKYPHEVQAWTEAGHTTFFLKPGWTHLQFWDQANKLTKCFPDLIKHATHAPRGTCFSVNVNGKIEPFANAD